MLATSAAYRERDGDRAEVADALTPTTMHAMLMLWTSLHGFVTLHAYPHLEWLGEAAQEALFRPTVEQGAWCAGLPTAP